MLSAGAVDNPTRPEPGWAALPEGAAVRGPGRTLLVIAAAKDAAADRPDGPWPRTRAEMESFAGGGPSCGGPRPPGAGTGWPGRAQRQPSPLQAAAVM
jgi:hypothetical protein